MMKLKNLVDRKSTRFNSNANINSISFKNHFKQNDYLRDISFEGLSFQSDRMYQKGITLTIEIPIISPTFRVVSEVIWCSKNDNAYDTGVKFLQVENGFRMKVLEQLRYIEEYRKKVYFEEGRELSCEEANEELVNYYRQDVH